MKKLLGIAVLSCLAINSYGESGDTYSEVTELKTFGSIVQIRLVEEHKCSKVPKIFYNIDLTVNEWAKDLHDYVKIAFVSNKKVNLTYVCDSSGVPRITNVRMKR